MKELKFEAVAMKDVPDPPMGNRNSKYLALYLEVKKLGLNQKDALRVEVSGPKELAAVKTAIGGIAKKEGRRLLSSRNQASTVGFFWMIKIEKE